MGLLKSVDNVPGIDFYEYRDDDYYGKYQYRARFKLSCVRYTWTCKTPEELGKRIKLKSGYFAIPSRDRAEILKQEQILKDFITFRNEIKKDKKATIRVEYNTVAVFSNDVLALQNIQTLFPSLMIDYTEVQKSQYAGIKHFVNEPKHKFRVYLKSKRVSETFAKDLLDLIRRTKTIHPSPALNTWLIEASDKNNLIGWKMWRVGFSSSSYFMDYDDESTLSYLALMHDGMLGKRYKLEKRPVTV
jgi:hypothetical protein